MDLSKAEGIISAIEAESKAPAPSHNNLARLVAMFCRDVVSALGGTPEPMVSVQESAPAVVETPPVQEPESPPLAKGPRGRHGSKKERK